jgi:hypothetical protein
MGLAIRRTAFLSEGIRSGRYALLFAHGGLLIPTKIQLAFAKNTAICGML